MKRWWLLGIGTALLVAGFVLTIMMAFKGLFLWPAKSGTMDLRVIIFIHAVTIGLLFVAGEYAISKGRSK